MILCPKCKNLADFNTYFGTYWCKVCDWEDKWFKENRYNPYYENNNIWKELDKHIQGVYVRQERIDKLNKITQKINE